VLFAKELQVESAIETSPKGYFE